VQWLNNSALGLHLNSGEAGRAMGNVPLTDHQVGVLTNQAINTEVAENAHASLHDRLFAVDNPNSLAANIILRMPTSVSAALTSLPQALTSMPAAIFHSIGSILTPRRASAAITSTAGAPYSWGTSTYGNVNHDKYDMVDNEQYLRGAITVNGKTFKRIDALGDPYTYTDSPSGDPNTNDLMHCFVDSYAMMADNSDGNPNQHFCGTLGTFNGKTPVIPDSGTIGHIYCAYAGDDSDACANSVKLQAGDDFGRYSQYLLDKTGMSTLKDWVSVY
jgi:hypothetical protein